jgi:preprotein translocase subunit YajC
MSDFLIPAAFAQAGQPQGSATSGLIMFAVLAAVFYFLLIRPQMKQVKEHRQLVESLAKGDEVVISGGLTGRINEVGDNFLVLEIARNVEVRVQKQSVSAILPKGTLKTL